MRGRERRCCFVRDYWEIRIKTTTLNHETGQEKKMKLAASDPQKKFFFQSILKEAASLAQSIGNTTVIFGGANSAEQIIIHFVRLLRAHCRPIRCVPSWWLDWLSVWKRDLLVSEAMTFYTQAWSYLAIASDIIDMQSLLSMFRYIMLTFTFLNAKACKMIKIQAIWINIYCP